MEESDEEDHYQAFDEERWSQEGSVVYSDEEADYESPPWPGDGYSSSEYEYEPREEEHEPEPPDDNQDNTDQSTWSREEETDQGESCEEESWHEETESQFSIEEGDHEIEAAHGELNHEDQFVEPYTHEEETDSLISLEEITEQNGEESEYQEEYAHESEDINEVERWEEDEPGRGSLDPASPPRHTSHGYTPQTQSKQGNSCEQFGFRLLTFSGHKQGPEAYINWERELEYWFRFNNIPKEERLAHAASSLVGEAHSWWLSEELMSHYIKPILTWGDLKQRMYREFVLRFHNQDYTPKRLMFQKITREAKKPIQVKDVQQSSISIPSFELQGKSPQGKSSNSNSVKLKEPTCYRCHKRGHFAATCPDRVVIKSTSLEPKPALGEMSTKLVESSFNSSNSRLMHLSLPKDVVTGCTKEPRDLQIGEAKHTEEQSYGAIRTYSDKEQTILQIANSINVSLNISRPISMILNSDIMHLFLVQNAEIVSGYKDVKEVPPDKHLLLEESTKKTSTKATKEVKDRMNQLRRSNHTQYQNRGLILSYLLKGEPPDVPAINKHQSNQGKTLNSKRRMKANLLSLGAGDLVSRSKLLQEGEYDEDIKSSSAQKQGIMRLGEGSMKLRRAKETCEQSSAQMDANTNPFSSTISWRTHSTHLELTSKKNQLKRSSYEEDIEDTTWKIFNEPAGDMRPLIKSFRSNDNESSNESKCFGFSTQRRSQENWVYIKPDSDLEVIEFTNRVNSKLPDLDQQALIGGLRLNQEELSCEPTCYGILVHHRIRESWNQAKIIFGLGVIQILNQALLDLPYLEAHEFMKLQTYLWRPGDFVLLPEASYTILRCTKPQHIPQIKRNQHLPFLEPLTFKSQRLFPYELGCNIVTYTINQKRPKAPRIFPKLSRYKQSNKFLYLAKIHLLRGQRLVFALISLSLLLFPLELVLEHYISSLLFHL